MEKLIIQSTEDTPQIHFDPTTNIFELSGKSYMENVLSFYEPILGWLSNYLTSPGAITKLIVKLEYFNTASAKIIFDIMSKLDRIKAKGHRVHILWYYKIDDEDMKEAGEGYEKNIESDIELISY